MLMRLLGIFMFGNTPLTNDYAGSAIFPNPQMSDRLCKIQCVFFNHYMLHVILGLFGFAVKHI